MGGRHVRSRGPRPRYSPSAEAERPQQGGELGADLLQRQIEQLGAHEGDSFFELSLEEVAERVAAHMRRPVEETLQKVELLERCVESTAGRSASEVVRRQLQRSMQGDGQQEDRKDEDDAKIELSLRGLNELCCACAAHRWKGLELRFPSVYGTGAVQPEQKSPVRGPYSTILGNLRLKRLQSSD